MYAGTHCRKENRRLETEVLAIPPGKRLNGIQPRYAPAVENCLSNVCQRTVHLERKSYKCTVEGGIQFQFDSMLA